MLTLTQYAKEKQLDEKTLEAYGLKTIGEGEQAKVAIPYLDYDGKLIRYKYRHAMSGKDKFTYDDRHGKNTFYGLFMLKKFFGFPYLLIVEGESDCHTCWQNGIPALGIPGSTGISRDEIEHYAGMFKHFKEIIVVQEPDAGGEALLNHIKGTVLEFRTQVMTLEPHKDCSAVHIAEGGDKEAFTSFFMQRMFTKRPLASIWGHELAEFLKLQVPPVEFWVDKLIQKHGDNLIGGKEGTLKTFTALGILQAMHNGEDSVWGLKLEPARVLYLEDDNGMNIMHDRIKAMLGQKPAKPSRFHLEYVNNSKNNLGFRFQFDDDKNVNRFVNYLEAREIDLVIMDSFKDFFIGDPTNAEHMSAYCNYKTDIKNRTGIALATLCHSTKGSVNDASGGNEYGVIKGDQRLLADADSIVMFSRTNQPDTIKFRQDKLRGAMKMGDIMKLQMVTDEEKHISFKFVANVNAELEMEQTATDRIMGVLNRSSEAITAEEVLEELGKFNRQIVSAGRNPYTLPDRGTVRTILNRQRDRGFLVSQKYGAKNVYILASRYEAPEPEQELPLTDEEREEVLSEMDVA